MLPGCGVVDNYVSRLPDNTCKRQATAISSSVLVREIVAGDCDICTRVSNSSSGNWATCSHCVKGLASKEEGSRRLVCVRRPSTNSVPCSVTVVQSSSACTRYTKDKSDKYGKKIYDKCIRRDSSYQKCPGARNRQSHLDTTSYCNALRADDAGKLMACPDSRKTTDCIAGAAMTCLAKVRCVLCGVGLNKPKNSSSRVLTFINGSAVYNTARVTTKLIREQTPGENVQRVDDLLLDMSPYDTAGNASDTLDIGIEQKGSSVGAASKDRSRQSFGEVQVGASGVPADTRAIPGHSACVFHYTGEVTSVEKQDSVHSERIQLVKAEILRRYGASALSKQDAAHSFVHTSCSRPTKLSNAHHGCLQSSVRSCSSTNVCSGSCEGARDLETQNANRDERCPPLVGEVAEGSRQDACFQHAARGQEAFSHIVSVGSPQEDGSTHQLQRGREGQPPQVTDCVSEFTKYSVNKKCGMLEYNTNMRCDRTSAARVNITAPAN